MKCPICRSEASKETSLRPFCSTQCRTLDLGNWVSEKYRIPTNQPASELDDERGGEHGAN